MYTGESHTVPVFNYTGSCLKHFFLVVHNVIVVYKKKKIANNTNSKFDSKVIDPITRLIVNVNMLSPFFKFN